MKTMYLREFWYIAAQSRELRTRPISRTLLGEPLVLFRQKNGLPAALIDRCAHRNMALSLGRVENGCVQCPYHGWEYEGGGHCVRIPSLQSGEKCPPDVSIRSYPTLESNGFIWVYMGVEQPASQPLPFPHYGETGWSGFMMKTRFPTNPLACLENFLDCPHTTYVHRGWFRSKDAQPVRAKVHYAKDGMEVEFFEERDAKSIVSRLLFPSDAKMVHTDKFLMPTTSRVDYIFDSGRHFIITSHCAPISTQETEVYTVVTFRFGRIAPLVRLFFEPLCRRIIRQDFNILKAQSEHMLRFDKPQFTFVESDLVAPYILKLWQQAALTEKGMQKEPADPIDENEREVRLQF
jgi:phenylpropionate dioxygenase-like ring-hydroxylating dioxygenase large terminal subunit